AESRTLTDRGKLLMALRMDSQGFVQRWLVKLFRGQVGSAYFDLLEPAERTPAEQVYGARLALLTALVPPPTAGCSGLAAGLARCTPLALPEGTLELLVPEARPRLDKLVQVKESRMAESDPAARAVVVPSVQSLFRPNPQVRPLVGGFADANSTLYPLEVV